MENTGLFENIGFATNDSNCTDLFADVKTPKEIPTVSPEQKIMAALHAMGKNDSFENIIHSVMMLNQEYGIQCGFEWEKHITPIIKCNIVRIPVVLSILNNNKYR